jgi:hypothetical protein
MHRVMSHHSINTTLFHWTDCSAPDLHCVVDKLVKGVQLLAHQTLLSEVAGDDLQCWTHVFNHQVMAACSNHIMPHNP